MGVLLFHLLTGTYPVVAQDLRGLRAAHERGERRSVRSLAPDTPQELALVLERALEPQPERRQPTADALGAELVKAAHGPQRRARLRRAAAAAIAGVALAIVVWQIASRPARMPDAAPGGSIAASSLASAGPAPAAQRAIVVLPFDNLSPEATSDTLVDGLTEEVLRDLARVDGLMVRSRFCRSRFADRSAICVRWRSDWTPTSRSPARSRGPRTA